MSFSASALATERRLEVIPVKFEFTFNRMIREEHQKSLYAVCCLDDIFATVGGNSSSVYRMNGDGSCDLILAYLDIDSEEVFYCCAWSFIDEPILLVGGLKGCVKAINVSRNEMECCFIGHGNAVNDIRVHPVNQDLVLTASKDESIRMWNLKTNVCIAIFCGHSGHRDEVLSIDIHPLGNCFVSGGMDSTIKIWSIESSLVRSLVKKSYCKEFKNSPAEFIQFPEFSTNLVHNNYIDSVKWYGNFILSNAVSDKISLWAPNPLHFAGDILPLQDFRVPQMNAWFVNIAISIELDVFAVGNNSGKIYVFRLTECLPGAKFGEEMAGVDRKETSDKLDSITNGNANACVILNHPKCTRIIRTTCFTEDNNHLIATCDDGTIWVWNIRQIISGGVHRVRSL